MDELRRLKELAARTLGDDQATLIWAIDTIERAEHAGRCLEAAQSQLQRAAKALPTPPSLRPSALIPPSPR